MKPIIRKIDKLGRIVLPIDYRKALGLSDKSKFALELDGTTVKLHSLDYRCKLCDVRMQKKSTLQINSQRCMKVRNPYQRTNDKMFYAKVLLLEQLG